MESKSKAPQIGQLCTIRGMRCRIIAIHDMGTIDVETLDGKRWFRVSGLPL